MVVRSFGSIRPHYSIIPIHFSEHMGWFKECGENFAQRMVFRATVLGRAVRIDHYYEDVAKAAGSIPTHCSSRRCLPGSLVHHSSTVRWVPERLIPTDRYETAYCVFSWALDRRADQCNCNPSEHDHCTHQLDYSDKRWNQYVLSWNKQHFTPIGNYLQAPSREVLVLYIYIKYTVT